MARLCSQCGIEFSGRHPRTITCSDACNLDRIRTYQRNYSPGWYQRHKDKVIEYSRKYAEKNSAQVKASRAQWRENNREYIREYRRRREAEQRAAFYALRELNLV